MAKKKIGIDIGNDEIKFAVSKRGKFTYSSLQMPENMMVSDRLKMSKSIVDFLKKARKKVKLPAGAECCLVLPSSQVQCRRMNTPYMTEQQLVTNLPYEFRDYIQQSANQYVYDYAMEDIEYDQEGTPVSMNLMAAAALKELIDAYEEAFRGARFKLEYIIPSEMAYVALLKQANLAGVEGDPVEVCLLDLGQETVKIFFYKGASVSTSRIIDMGCMEIDHAIAEEMNVDIYVANTYRRNNFENILESEACMRAYSQLAIEVMKVVNFYRFNNRGNNLENIYCAGGGAEIASLVEAIGAAVGLKACSITELLPAAEDMESACRCHLACGGAM